MRREAKNMEHRLVVDQVKRRKKMRVEESLKTPVGPGGGQGGGRRGRVTRRHPHKTLTTRRSTSESKFILT